MEKISLKTNQRNVFIDITSQVKAIVSQSNVKDGICVVYCPHTTGGITINESYDPDVQDDLSFAMNKLVPNMKEFKHAEGNSDSHTKTSIIGPSETLIIENGKLMLGRWQGIYFAEFDGPRTREVWIKTIG
ncbi:MAG: secondary thiamine-phosphate synthase enzyme YjbQ [Vampirovibrionia bacterium]